ncbi:hypothetical protein H9L21_06510 [Aeromicrobium senzhongii]|uniref:DUF6318 domain-containing protein n=1 Tax=Aeromicrobium senzhongii TaxID=2663859 RepID=A0ABX6SX29_9ACTN|nr:DUF6318 family protein [Aeromicrobium senzhongii]MTB87381.1 hypothetical protein [Aeromicrobium senzhongii]QNL95561.1 hypothetical protein H9L21_06510 [Aeromicrobium senzhongii]
MRILATAVVASLALSLGACSEDEPRDRPDASSEATVRPPSSPPPARPVGMTADSPQGVTDFVSYYLKVLSYAHLTGNTEELGRLSDVSCSACQSYVSAIDELAKDGGTITGGTRTFSGAKVRYSSSGGESLLTINVKIGSGTRQATPASEKVRIAASEMRLTFGVKGTGGDRRISRIFQGDPT